MNIRKSTIAGWVISFLLAAFLIFASAVPKFVEWEAKEEMFAKLGYSTELMMQIGFVEIAVAVLFVIPRTGFLGAVLLTAYLGGATVTHVRVGDPYFMPIVMGVVVWVALGLRQPTVFSLAFGTATSASDTQKETTQE